MDPIYENFEAKNPVCQLSVSNPPASIKSNRRCYLGVITFMIMLSVLLLAGLIIFGLLYADSVRNLSEISDNKDNFTEHLNAVIERLNSSLTKKTKELMDFKQRKTECPAESIDFGSSCYFLSGEFMSWHEARDFCRAREADLAVIKTQSVKIFISKFEPKPVWIGLSDEALEGTWKWVDGSSLTLQFWGGGQPDNGAGKYGEEDCVQFVFDYSGIWNDISCTASLQGLCEKKG